MGRYAQLLPAQYLVVFYPLRYIGPYLISAPAFLKSEYFAATAASSAGQVKVKSELSLGRMIQKPTRLTASSWLRQRFFS